MTDDPIGDALRSVDLPPQEPRPGFIDDAWETISRVHKQPRAAASTTPIDDRPSVDIDLAPSMLEEAPLQTTGGRGQANSRGSLLVRVAAVAVLLASLGWLMTRTSESPTATEPQVLLSPEAACEELRRSIDGSDLGRERLAVADAAELRRLSSHLETFLSDVERSDERAVRFFETLRQSLEQAARWLDDGEPQASIDANLRFVDQHFDVPDEPIEQLTGGPFEGCLVPDS